MTAQYASTEDARGSLFRVWCDDPKCPRPLDMAVGTDGHAVNLVAKHNREHHPSPDATTSYDVSAAARAYLANHHAHHRGSGPDLLRTAAALTAAEEVWHALTGLTGRAALDAAEHAATHQTTAHAVPF